MIHLYTGNGKGKTTAAMGLALRFAGYRRPVVVVQFLKGKPSGEITALLQFQCVTVLRNNSAHTFFGQLSEWEQRAVTRENTENLRAAIALAQRGACELLVLDEVCAAYAFGAADRNLIDRLLRDVPEGLELVLTGRDAPAHFYEAADYVSVISAEKHPFDCGAHAREGVEY